MPAMIRKGDPVYESRAEMAAIPLVGPHRPGDQMLGWACHDAEPGQEIEIERAYFTDATGVPLRQKCRVRTQ